MALALVAAGSQPQVFALRDLGLSHAVSLTAGHEPFLFIFSLLCKFYHRLLATCFLPKPLSVNRGYLPRQESHYTVALS